MKISALIVSLLMCVTSCLEHQDQPASAVIGPGQMPNITKDQTGTLHLVYGNGDSILYSNSSDMGATFSPPALISVLPNLAASHTRGPQIAATTNGLAVTACNDYGDIFSYSKDQAGNWSQTARVNDMDTTAKENLMALAADGHTAFAVWLDLRDRHNKIFGARSTDGGKSWSKNIMVYASPDTTVCECCKPSVAVNGNNVFIMFRNWLDGNRDLYLIKSSDGGNTFQPAKKLGIGTWTINACPMDGGGLVIDAKGNPETVWNRKGVIYSCKPGEKEIELGEGKNCTIESVNGKNIYAWVEDGNIMIRKREGEKLNLGQGQQPVIKAVDNEHILCIWENNKKIRKAIVQL